MMRATDSIPIPETWSSERSKDASEILMLIDQLDKLTEDAVSKSQSMKKSGLPLPPDAQQKLIRTHHNIHKISPLVPAKWPNQDSEYLTEKQHTIRYLPITEGRTLTMAVSATPLLRWHEFRDRLSNLAGNSALQIILTFASALLAFLYGEVTLPLAALLIVSFIRLLLGNCPSQQRGVYKASPVYVKMYKSIQYFIVPFLIVAVANLIILTISHQANFSGPWTLWLMSFVPSWLAVSEGRSAFISLLSYRTPGAKKFYKLGTDLKRSFSDFFSMDE